MKKIVTILAIPFFCASQLQAQLVWDDFSQGEFDPISAITLPKTTIEITDARIPAGKRVLSLEVGNNPYRQPFSARMQDGLLIASTGYGTAASIKIDYGGSREKALNKDLSSFKTLKISFTGKSNFARVYVNMWSNGPNRAL